MDLAHQLRQLPADARRDLLRVLTSPSHVRADVIRQFFERPSGREMAQVLMDLEEDDLLRMKAIAALQQTLGRDKSPPQLS